MLLLIIVLILLFGGGGFYGYRSGYYGSGGMSLATIRAIPVKQDMSLSCERSLRKDYLRPLEVGGRKRRCQKRQL